MYHHCNHDNGGLVNPALYPPLIRSSVTIVCYKSLTIHKRQFFSLAAATVLECLVGFLPAAETEAPRCTSLHGAAAVAGLDPGPANVQPGQLGTVLKKLLDGNMTHVQL